MFVGFWHESDWSRRKIILFFLLFLNNEMNNARLSSATGWRREQSDGVENNRPA